MRREIPSLENDLNKLIYVATVAVPVALGGLCAVVLIAATLLTVVAALKATWWIIFL